LKERYFCLEKQQKQMSFVEIVLVDED